MNLGDCQEVACATNLRAFEAHLARFACSLDFEFMNGTLILERLDGSVEAIPFGNIPRGYKAIFESNETGKRSPVMRRLKQLRVPFVYDQSMYIDEGAADIWELQAAYGFKTGIALRLDAEPRKHFLIGIDRRCPLPGDSQELARLTADFHLYAAHAQLAAMRLLGPLEDGGLRKAPTLSVRELEILKWTSEGKSAWAVGQILNTSEHTVNYHLRGVMTKLAVGSKHQAAAKARMLGLL